MEFCILGKYSCLFCMVSWKIIYFDLIKNLNCGKIYITLL